MFVPGYPPHPFLLSRHLPPLGEGIAAAYIERYSAPGDLILDLFGQSPRVALEAAQLGRRAIITTNNPTLRLALGAAFWPAPAGQLRLALTRLADARVVDGRLEPYIRRLYQSTCPDCRSPIEVDAFHWEKDSLVEKSYHCDGCHDDKTRPTDEADREQAARFSARGPHFHWALDRVIPADDPDADLFADALDAYPPRALSAVFNITNKAQSLDLAPDLRRALDLLLLAAYDDAIALEGQRPRNLKPHSRYRERNIWLALERLARSDAWQSPHPNPPPFGVSHVGEGKGEGVEIFDGSLRALAEGGRLPPHTVPLCLAALPRPNLVLWVLSSLWAGWLWGEPAARSLRQLIRRRRYDWAWHETALRTSFQTAQALLAPEGRLVALLPEAEPGFVGATLTALDGAGYTLAAPGLRAHPPEAQFVAQPDSLAAPRLSDLSPALRAGAASAARQVLRERGEPSRWHSVSGAAFVNLARDHILRAAVEHLPADPLDVIFDEIETGCLGAESLTTFKSEDSEAETVRAANVWWWLTDPAAPGVAAPLSDRAEAETAHLLAAHPAGIDLVTLEQRLCDLLAGLTLPGGEIVRACLESYGQERDGLWFCRPEDRPEARAADRARIRDELIRLGQRLHFEVDSSNDSLLTWGAGSGAVAYHLFITDTAAIARFVGAPPPGESQRLIIVPGSRSGLIHFKLARNLPLKQAVARGRWSFVKYRHIRRLLELDPNDAALALTGDPITERTSSQLSLL